MAGLWNTFTESAKRTVLYAQVEACKQGVCLVEPEHLASALVQTNLGLAVTGTTAVQLMDALRFPQKLLALAPVVVKAEDQPAQADLLLSPDAKHLIDLAIVECNSLKDIYFGTEHLLLALTQKHPIFVTPEWNRDAHLAVLHALRRSNPAPWWHLEKHSLREA